MRKAFALVLFLAALPLGAQRINDRVITTVLAPPAGGYPPILGVPGAFITLCQYPASGVPCSNVATTYTDATLTTQCPLSAQVVLQGSSSCTNHADPTGAMGFFVTSGCYAYTAQNPISNAITGPFTVCTGTGGGTPSGGGGGVYTHTLSGNTPSAVVNSLTNPAIDIQYLTLTSNTSAIQLPSAGNVADGEALYFTISQAAVGGPFTIGTTTANAPIAPGGGTVLNSALVGSCPNLGGIVSGSAPSQIFVSVQFQASINTYTLLGCESVFPSPSSVAEFAIPAATGQYGGYNVGTPLVSAVPVNAGHFTNLSVVSLGGVCDTPPTFNVFAGASSFGVPLTAVAGAQGPGGATNKAQNLPFYTGNNVGIYVSSTGVNCKYAYFSVAATAGEP